MKTVKLFLTLGILVLLNAAAVPAQEKAPEKLGKVSFPTSCDRKVQAAVRPCGGDAALVLVSAR